MDGIQEIMEQLRRQRKAIEEALLALERGFMAGGTVPTPATRTVTKKAARKGGMTPAGRERLRQAMKRRWAVKRAAATARKRGRSKRI